MKETNKMTRLFCISWIICTCSYLCTAFVRIHMYASMMENNIIEEAVIRRIDLMDTIIFVMKYMLILLMIAAFLYMANRLIHTALKRDCRVALGAFAICIFLSFLSVLFLQIPSTTAFAPFQFIPHFLFVLGSLAVINALRKRYAILHTHNFT